MKGLMKFLGGVMFGAAIGTGLYLALTDEKDDGFVHGVKSLLTEIVEDGRLAADTRRTELAKELEKGTI